MLVLTRKPAQSIMIGDGIEVQVLSVSGEKVRLGITAPRDVSIFREEVLERIQADEGDSGGNGKGTVDRSSGRSDAEGVALERLRRAGSRSSG